MKDYPMEKDNTKLNSLENIRIRARELTTCVKGYIILPIEYDHLISALDAYDSFIKQGVVDDQ